MKCEIHDTEMEWVPVEDDAMMGAPGFWYCEECRIEEEGRSEDEEDSVEEPACVYCGSQTSDGYCWKSDDGYHHMSND